MQQPLDEARDGHVMKRNNNNNKILLVDDEPSITSLFSIALEDCGFEVDSFNDPLLALDTFKQKYRAKENSSYALALVDIKMSGMSGFDLFNEIRKINDKIKVCFITAFDLQNEENKVLKAMLTSILNSNKEKHSPPLIRKPITIDDFVKMIKAEMHSLQCPYSLKQTYFLMCGSCFWCASDLSLRPIKNEIIPKCPMCDGNKISIIPIKKPII